jgi:transcriptional regulator with XRE-family HTH domain
MSMPFPNISAPRVTRAPVSAVRLNRMSRGLRLSDVAGCTGICIATLSEIERGLRQPTEDQQRKLAIFYGGARART